MNIREKVIDKAMRRIEYLESYGDYMELSSALDIMPAEIDTLDNKKLQELWKENENFFGLLKQYIPNANHQMLNFLWCRIDEAKEYSINPNPNDIQLEKRLQFIKKLQRKISENLMGEL